MSLTPATSAARTVLSIGKAPAVFEYFSRYSSRIVPETPLRGVSNPTSRIRVFTSGRDQAFAGRISMLRWCFLLLLLPLQVSAQYLYVRTNPGITIVPGIEVSGTDNDTSTKCDLLTNPTLAETTECTMPPPGAWSADVGRGSGFSSAVAVGQRWDYLRIEGEYIFRTATYGDHTAVRIGDEITLAKSDQELEALDHYVDDLVSHCFFLNVYYDFPVASAIGVYVGAGAGFSRTSMDYFARWKRNDDPAYISTFEDPVLKARLAGTTSIAKSKLWDTLTGYQARAGMNYTVNQNLAFGVDLRVARFSRFEAEDRYIQIRSHESSVGRGFDVLYGVSSGDLSSVGIGIHMSYQFAN